MSLIFFGLISNVYAVEGAYQVELPVPTQRDILLHVLLPINTPKGVLIALGERIGAQLFVYPEAYHGFDNPTGKVRLRRDVPNGVNPGEGVHVGPHSASRADAYDKLKSILERLSFK